MIDIPKTYTPHDIEEKVVQILAGQGLFPCR